jgi:CheY-like chemotaxis protein
MQSPHAEQSRGSVLLLEPNAALRSAIVTIATAERYRVELVETLEQVLQRATDHKEIVAVVAWQSMQGLLAEEQRSNLVKLTRRLRLVVMVPRRWARLLEGTDLSRSVTALIAKPFQADELIEILQAAFATKVAAMADSITR